MELDTLKRKLSTFKTESGRLKNVSDELLMEILSAWETWSGSGAGFYRAIGTNHKKFASLLGKAKKLKREGYIASEFQEVKVVDTASAPQYRVELVWNNHVIRFGDVDSALEFLRKVA